jgi:hypothetical protein
LLNDFAWALGAAHHGMGRRADGIALMGSAVRGFAEQNLKWSFWAGRLGALGGAYILDGRLGDATQIAQDGLVIARQRGERGERGVECQALRLLGNISAYPERFEVDTAETHYRQAQALAEVLGQINKIMEKLQGAIAAKRVAIERKVTHFKITLSVPPALPACFQSSPS